MQYAYEIVLFRLGILKSTMKFRYFIWYFHTVIRVYTNSDELYVINSAYI